MSADPCGQTFNLPSACLDADESVLLKQKVRLGENQVGLDDVPVNLERCGRVVGDNEVQPACMRPDWDGQLIVTNLEIRCLLRRKGFGRVTHLDWKEKLKRVGRQRRIGPTIEALDVPDE